MSTYYVHIFRKLTIMNIFLINSCKDVISFATISHSIDLDFDGMIQGSKSEAHS